MTTPLRGDRAVSETIGAIILFGIFVATIAILNVASVPQAGLNAEEKHVEEAQLALNGLQSESASAGVGVTVSRAVPLAPERAVGSDFFSWFVAQPARASGEITFAPSYGNVTLTHLRNGNPTPVADVGSSISRLPFGRLVLDPHPVFRAAGTTSLEAGGLVATEGASRTLRFAPQIQLAVAGTSTRVSVVVPLLNGTEQNLGGTAAARVSLVAESRTLNAPQNANAASATLRLETENGRAWGAWLNATSTAAGLSSPGGYTTTVSRGTGLAGLDVVAWTVNGIGTGNDVTLTSGITLYRVNFA